MLKNIVFVSLMCLITFSSKAQFQEEELSTFSIGAGYFGELFTHPGVNFFADYAITNSQNQFLTRFSITNYRHIAHTRNWMFMPDIIYRRNTEKMNFFELSLGLGCVYQRADSKVLVYSDGGFHESKRGWFYSASSLAFRTGKQINKNITPYIGAKAFGLYPFNSDLLWRFAIEFGLSYKLN